MLVPYVKDGLELIVNQATGETFASISACARMTDKSIQTVSAYVNRQLGGLNWDSLFLTEIQTPGGTQGVKLLNEEQILDVITFYKPTLLRQFAKIGLRAFLHQLAGYQVLSTAVQTKEELTDDDKMILLAESVLKLNKEKKALEAAKTQLEAKIEEDTPKVEFYEAVANTKDLQQLGHFIPTCGVGRNTGFKFLRELKIIQTDRAVPYQRFINEGYFEIKVKVTKDRYGRERQDLVTLVTPKGEIFVEKKLREYQNRN